MKRFPLAVLSFALALLPAPSVRAQMRIGVNLDALNWDNRIKPFTNLALTMDPGWTTPGSSFNAANAPLNALGYPLAPAGAIGKFETGSYNVSFTGDADGYANMVGLIVPLQNVQKVNGVTTATFTLSDPNAGNYVSGFNFSRVNPANPPGNLKIWRQGEDVSQTFGGQFLKLDKPFKTARLMDWNRVNDREAGEWSQRTLPGTFSQAGRNGVAYEYMIELANRQRQDLFVPVPDNASDDYLRNLGALFKQQLDPSLKVTFTLSNETWNQGAMKQAQRLDAKARADASLPSNDIYERHDQEVAKESLRYARALKAADPAAKFDLSAQWANPYTAKHQLDYIAGLGIDPRSVIDGVEVAPYSSNYDDDGPNLTPRGILDQLHHANVAYVNGLSKQTADFAAAYGITTIDGYEANSNGVITVTGAAAAKTASYGDPAMYGSTLEYLQQAQAGKVNTLNWFTLVGDPNGVFGSFPLYSDMNGTPNGPRTQAVLDFIAANPTPEPAALSLLALSGVFLRRRRAA